MHVSFYMLIFYGHMPPPFCLHFYYLSLYFSVTV
ncbi:hypothetical protein NC652_037552 [Populus alba x Populus x berolinensis]|nr:hypothetical protein NC652_037552 [Populus alba x Populus x berolinensis]